MALRRLDTNNEINVNTKSSLRLSLNLKDRRDLPQGLNAYLDEVHELISATSASEFDQDDFRRPFWAEPSDPDSDLDSSSTDYQQSDNIYGDYYDAETQRHFQEHCRVLDFGRQTADLRAPANSGLLEFHKSLLNRKCAKNHDGARQEQWYLEASQRKVFGLKDYQDQLTLLEQRNQERLKMAENAKFGPRDHVDNEQQSPSSGWYPSPPEHEDRDPITVQDHARDSTHAAAEGVYEWLFEHKLRGWKFSGAEKLHLSRFWSELEQQFADDTFQREYRLQVELLNVQNARLDQD